MLVSVQLKTLGSNTAKFVPFLDIVLLYSMPSYPLLRMKFEAAVTGLPDPVRGQAVKATIVLASGYEPGEELTKKLQTHVKQSTAPYKYPRVVE